MTLPFKGGARFPGPLGTSPETLGGRLPGPMGRTLWDKKSLSPAPDEVAKVSKTFPMPPPATPQNPMSAQKVPWELFNGEPATSDVTQGELATCPIASILAALAHTGWGRTHIKSKKGIVQEHKTGVKTTLSDDIVKALLKKVENDPDYRKQSKEVISDRYFTVTLGNQTKDVSDVFYTKYADPGSTLFELIYMQAARPGDSDNKRETLWPAVIEKAYAVLVGSYEKLDDYGPTGIKVDVYWTAIVGSKPETILILDPTDEGYTEKYQKDILKIISNAAAKASQSPTIGASRTNATKVTDTHGFAVMGIQGSIIELYNPWGKTEKISLEDFRDNFSHIFRKP